MSILWLAITNLGDLTVLLPSGLMLGLWIAAGRGPAAGFVWLFLLGVVAVAVAATKIAFLGWGIGSEALNFTGLSGHSAYSALVLPVLGHVIGARPGDGVGRRFNPYVAAGVALSCAVALSRVLLHRHSPTEAIAGTAVGLAVSLGFIRWCGPVGRKPAWRDVVATGLVLTLVMISGHRAPTERVLRRVAMTLSNHDRVFGRADWRQPTIPAGRLADRETL